MDSSADRAALDGLPFQVWTAQPDGNLDFVNQATAAYFGISSERLLRDGWRDVCHPLDLIEVWRHWQHSLSTGEPYEVAFRLRRGRDGMFLWHLARANAVRRADGEITHWVGINSEVDSIKRAAELGNAVAERNKRELAGWRTIVEHAPIGVVIVAGDGIVQACNQMASGRLSDAAQVGARFDVAFPELNALLAGDAEAAAALGISRHDLGHDEGFAVFAT